jgi:ribosomal protein L4
MFTALGVNEQNVLFVVADRSDNVDRSVRNLPTVKMLQPGYLNVRDLLGHDVLVMVRDTVDLVESWLGTEAASVSDTGTLAAAGTEE